MRVHNRENRCKEVTSGSRVRKNKMDNQTGTATDSVFASMDNQIQTHMSLDYYHSMR